MLKIEKAGVKDHGVVTGLFIEFAESRGLSPAVDRDRWDRVIAELLNSDKWLFVVARDAGKPVGFAAATWFLTLHGTRQQARLTAVIVDEEHRRSGVGTHLMRSMMEAARRRGCWELEAVVETGDEVSGAFYRSFEGFIENTAITWRCDG
jgi:L-amino acid N-acyltransferase YncA